MDAQTAVNECERKILDHLELRGGWSSWHELRLGAFGGVVDHAAALGGKSLSHWLGRLRVRGAIELRGGWGDGPCEVRKATGERRQATEKD